MPALATLAFRKHAEEREPRVVHWLKARVPTVAWLDARISAGDGRAGGWRFVLSLDWFFHGPEFIPVLMKVRLPFRPGVFRVWSLQNPSRAPR